MCKSHFVMLGVMFWALVGVLSLPYESIGIGEFTVKTLQYTILGGGFGGYLHSCIKSIIKEIKG